MVPFAGNDIINNKTGYHLPIQYPTGIVTEHLHCRKSCSLFDVSHMGNFKIFGKDRYEFLERLVVGDMKELKPNFAQLSLIMNKDGGIVDDTVITNMGDHMY